MQVPGDHQRHGDFHDLGRLEAWESRQVQPALGALGDCPDEENDHQEDDAGDVERRCPAQVGVRIDLGGDDHGDQCDTDAQRLVDYDRGVLLRGAVQHHQPEREDGAEREHQPGIDLHPEQPDPFGGLPMEGIEHCL